MDNTKPRRRLARNKRIRALTRRIWKRSRVRGWLQGAAQYMTSGRLHFTPKAIAVIAGALALLIAIPLTVSALSGTASTSQRGGIGISPTPGGFVSLNTQEPDVYTISAPTASPPPTPEPSPTPMLLHKGMTDEELMPTIQQRLMELGYMDYDEPTSYFGPITKEAVERFQKKHDLTPDGYVGEETYRILMSGEAKKYTVTIGDSGTDVKELQIRLRELGYISKATQYFGTETEAAVKKFQERNGLSADGSVGENTREMLYSENVRANAVTYGEKSDEVLAFQKRLAKLGYLTGTPDGTFGKDTVTAVRRFQEHNGIIADGYIGPQTKQLLLSSDAQPNALTLGAKGRDVEQIQQRLKELGYLKSVTGYYGSDTVTAVRNFQHTNKLSVDGKVGAYTMTRLQSDSAKKYSGTNAPSGGTSKPGGSTKPGGSSGSNDNTPSGSTTVESFLSIAKSKLGSRYVRGAKGPNTFDCSGFVYYCLNKAGVTQGYMTSASWRNVSRYQRMTSMREIRAGDVVVFYGHVGIALSGSQMIDASSGDGQVRICALNKPYWNKNFICAYRIF